MGLIFYLSLTESGLATDLHHHFAVHYTVIFFVACDAPYQVIAPKCASYLRAVRPASKSNADGLASAAIGAPVRAPPQNHQFCDRRDS